MYSMNATHLDICTPSRIANRSSTAGSIQQLPFRIVSHPISGTKDSTPLKGNTVQYNSTSDEEGSSIWNPNNLHPENLYPK